MVAEPIERSIQIVESGQLTRADEWNKRRIDFVRTHLCGGAPDAEASAFIEICKRRGLAPEEKQVYLIKRRTKDDNGEWQEVWTPQTGIDGYRLMADRTGKYAGSDDPVFEGEVSFMNFNNEVIHPERASVTVWKIVDGVRCPFSASARWQEYYPGAKGGKFWHSMPYTMLGKCAEALALRKAFPADLSGIYTNEEMDQASRDGALETPGRILEQPARAVTATNGNGAPKDWSEFYKRAKAAGFDRAKIEKVSGSPVPDNLGEATKLLAQLVKAEKDAVAQPAPSPEPAEDAIDADATVMASDDQKMELVGVAQNLGLKVSDLTKRLKIKSMNDLTLNLFEQTLGELTVELEEVRALQSAANVETGELAGMPADHSRYQS